MIAKRLEGLVGGAAKRGEAEMVQRFQKLRDFGLLPKSRGKNADDLSPDEIVSGILSIVAARPGYAGLTAKFLKGLRPVGGTGASFASADSFGQAIQALFIDAHALDSLVEVRVSDSEVYTNSNGRAVIVYRADRQEKTAYYVRKEAVSLMQAGAEKSYNPHDLISDVITETIFLPRLFNWIDRELTKQRRHAEAMRAIPA